MADALLSDPRAPVTRLVGRSAELADLQALTSEHRLVTIAGPGGSGKTRLAAELADRIVRPPGGAKTGAVELRWLELAPVTAALEAAHACARVLGVRLEADGRDPVAALVAALRHRRVTVVFDTCEHLLEPLTELVERIVAGCPGVSIVATSREPLGVPGEAVWRVPPLAPAEAAELFVDRARLVAHDVELSAQDPLIAAICDRLDGLPLAIEIVSASIRVFSAAQILAGLDEQFRLLTGGLRRGAGRHRTLAASMEWSHDLLEPAEREVFRRLAVFVGDFELAGVEEVCAPLTVGAEPIVVVLARLVDKSLVVADHGGQQVRYRLLDTVREFAADQLVHAGEFAPVRDRHLSWCLQAMHRVEEALQRDQDAAMRLFDRAESDATAALDWALQPDTRRRRRGRMLAHLMVLPWFLRSQSHRGRPFLNRAMAATVEPDDGLAGVLAGDAALLGIVAGGTMQQWRDRGHGDLGELARARFAMVSAFEAFFTDHDAAESEALAASELAHRAGDRFVEDLGLILAAYALAVRELHTRAQQVVEPAARRSAGRGDRFCMAAALGVRQVAALQAGQVAKSVSLGREAVALVEPLGDHFCYGTMAVNLAIALSLHGDLSSAREVITPIVAVAESTSEVDVVGLPAAMGYLCSREGAWPEALRWFDRGLARLADGGNDWTAVRCIPGAIEALRRLDRADEAAALADRGLRLGITAPEYLAKLAEQRAFLQPVDDPLAATLHRRALEIRIRTGMELFVPDSLDALAAHHALEHPADAVRLLAASTAARARMGCPRPRHTAACYEAQVAGLRARLEPDAFEDVWRAGLATSLAEAGELAQRGRRRPARPETGWASLTPAELGVVQLVAQGLTNADIAGRLLVSRATVKTHLYHVFTKLGTANRTELASLAHAQLTSSTDADPAV